MPSAPLFRTAPSSRQRGGTLLGLVIGVVLGLGIAVGVALFITKAPVPFVNRAGSRPADAIPPPGAQLPDPNKPLYGRDVAPLARTGADAGEKKFSLYDVAPSTPVPGTSAPQAASQSASQAASQDDGKTRYLLQAGAFKNEPEAEAMKARLALLGYAADVSVAEKDGTKLHRVRIGPVSRQDDMNRMRQTLVQNGIDPSIIRVQ